MLKLLPILTMITNMCKCDAVWNQVYKCAELHPECSFDFQEIVIEQFSRCQCFKNLFNNNVKINGDQVELLCRSSHSVTLKFLNSTQKYHTIQIYSLNANLTTFLLTNTKFLKVKNMTENEVYQIKQKGGDIVFSAIPNFQPGLIESFKTEKWASNGKKSASAHIIWKPVELVPSCNYFVTIHAGFQEIEREISNVSELFDIKISNLIYNNYYTVMISSFTETLEGKRLIKEFQVPSCFELNKENSTICPAEPVKGVVIDERPVSQKFLKIVVSWDSPEIHTNIIDIEISAFRENQTALFYNRKVPQNITQISFEHVYVESHYVVRIWTRAPGGTSDPVVIHRTRRGLSIRNKHFEISPWHIFSIIAFFTFLGAIGFFILWLKQRKIKNFTENEVECQDESIPLDFDVNTEVNPEDIVVQEVIGEGAFGVVKKGILRSFSPTEPVAIKTIREKATQEEKHQFFQEIRMLQTIGNHPNIVSMIGCCTKGSSSNDLFLIEEYCEFGDLLKYLQNVYISMISSQNYATFPNVRQNPSYVNVLNPNAVYNKTYDKTDFTNKLSLVDLLSFGHQVSIGMEYLSKNRIIHRDLAARNILVSKNLILKISDFGLSRDAYETNCYLKSGDGKLPVKWMAIESLLNRVYTSQSDVWSFGVLLWEILMFGSMPYAELHSLKLLIPFLTSGQRLMRPRNCPSELYKVMRSCWALRPKDRPTFTALRNSLEKIYRDNANNENLNQKDLILLKL